MDTGLVIDDEAVEKLDGEDWLMTYEIDSKTESVEGLGDDDMESEVDHKYYYNEDEYMNEPN